MLVFGRNERFGEYIRASDYGPYSDVGELIPKMFKVCVFELVIRDWFGAYVRRFVVGNLNVKMN